MDFISDSMEVYIYIHIYTCLYMYIYIFIYMWVYKTLSASLSLYIYIYLYIHKCICIYIINNPPTRSCYQVHLYHRYFCDNVAHLTDQALLDLLCLNGVKTLRSLNIFLNFYHLCLEFNRLVNHLFELFAFVCVCVCVCVCARSI